MSRCSKLSAAAAPLLAAQVLAGCSGGASLMDASLAGYSAANAVITHGHSERQIDATRYEVSANGTETTPADRVRRIALARAAEIGTEEKLAFFKVTGETTKVTCRARQEFHRGNTVPAARSTTVTLSVVYAKGPNPPEPDYQPSSATFDKVRAELDAETYPADVLASTAASHRAACGG